MTATAVEGAAFFFGADAFFFGAAFWAGASTTTGGNCWESEASWLCAENDDTPMAIPTAAESDAVENGPDQTLRRPTELGAIKNGAGERLLLPKIPITTTHSRTHTQLAPYAGFAQPPPGEQPHARFEGAVTL